MGTPSNIDEYTLKRLCAENGVFVRLVTIILLSHLTNSRMVKKLFHAIQSIFWFEDPTIDAWYIYSTVA